MASIPARRAAIRELADMVHCGVIRRERAVTLAAGIAGGDHPRGTLYPQVLALGVAMHRARHGAATRGQVDQLTEVLLFGRITPRADMAAAVAR